MVRDMDRRTTPKRGLHHRRHLHQMWQITRHAQAQISRVAYERRIQYRFDHQDPEPMQNPDSCAFWICGLISQRRIPVLGPPAWGDW
eukprot:4778463-Pyramimonas_sp.AAC.1